jgi:hypothetical protein
MIRTLKILSNKNIKLIEKKKHFYKDYLANILKLTKLFIFILSIKKIYLRTFYNRNFINYNLKKIKIYFMKEKKLYFLYFYSIKS